MCIARRQIRLVASATALWATLVVSPLSALAQVSTCGGVLFIDYVQPPTPNYAQDADVVRIRLTFGAGRIRNGTHLTIDKVRFSLDCRKEATFPGLCTDHGPVIYYPGDVATSFSTSCLTTWFSDNPPGGLQNELVFDATPNFDIPRNTASFCFLEFSLIVKSTDAARSDASPDLVEQRAFCRGQDALCDNNLGTMQTQSASLPLCPVCDDGNACNGLEACNQVTGECVPGTDLNCDDGDACTADTCDPTSGCIGATVVCDDGDSCTIDACDPTSGCVHSSTPAWIAGVGWNSMGPAVGPCGDAEAVCQAARRSGVLVTEVARWSAGGWQSHICGLPFNDFPIVAGVGYFVRAATAGTWCPPCPEIPSPVRVPLAVGWNMASPPGWANGYTAESACAEISQQGGEVAEIVRWRHGGWYGHLCGLPFGNFELNPGEGFFLRATRPSTWTLGRP